MCQLSCRGRRKRNSLLRLAHVRIEVVEVSKLGGAETGVGVCGVVALVVFDVDEDIVLSGRREQLLVLVKELDGGLGD